MPGIDGTIERRRGERIAAEGIYRDPVRSSHGHSVEAGGLRRSSPMLLAPIPWAGRVRALPFLTALAPSERWCRERDRRHKKLTDRARQMASQARRWLPSRSDPSRRAGSAKADPEGRELVLVGDDGFSALGLLASLARRGVVCVTRPRLDAALYEPAPVRAGTAPQAGHGRAPSRSDPCRRPASARTDAEGTEGERPANLSEVLTDAATRWRRVAVPGRYGEGERTVELRSGTAVWRHGGMPVVPIRWVLPRDPRKRFDLQASLCTEPGRDPLRIVGWFVRRWQLEVTFREARDHLGVETQRRWSDLAIARATPRLLGLFSLVTLSAARLSPRTRSAVATAAWYRKTRPTSADTLAAVRRHVWAERGFFTSRHAPDATKPPPDLREGIVHALCHAA